MFRLLVLAAVICAGARTAQAALGGKDGHISNAPWVAQIQIETPSPDDEPIEVIEEWAKKSAKANCLAILVNPMQVLTTASCVHDSVVKNARDMLVTAECTYTTFHKWQRGYNSIPTMYDLKRVSKRDIHPLYKKGSPEYDLAVLTIVEPFDHATDKYDHDMIKAIDIATPEQAAAVALNPDTTAWGYKKAEDALVPNYGTPPYTTKEPIEAWASLRQLFAKKTDCGDKAVNSQVCYELENGSLDAKTDVGAPLWLPKTKDTPPLLIGVHTTSFNEEGRSVSRFDDLLDPKTQEWLKKTVHYKPPGKLSKLIKGFF